VSKEESAKVATTVLNDYVASRDTKEVQVGIQGDLLGGGCSGAVALATWFTNAFEKKDIPRDASKVGPLF